MATNKRVLGRIGFYLGLAVFLFITLFPFFVMLMTSFKSAREAISLHPTILPQEWTLQHYIDIFNPLIFPFVDYFRNSMVVSLTSSIVAVFLGTLQCICIFIIADHACNLRIRNCPIFHRINNSLKIRSATRYKNYYI